MTRRCTSLGPMVLISLAAAVAVIVGCTTGSPTVGPDAAAGATGTARIRIQWPEGDAVGGREIPSATESISVTLTRIDTGEELADLAAVIDRPSAEAFITGIPAMAIRFDATAWSKPGGAGFVLAQGSATETIRPDGTPGAPTPVGIVLTPRDDTSMIAFSSNRSGNWDIWVMYPDGTRLTQLTQGPDEDNVPTWSPDGSRIAFGRKDASGYDLWTVSLDGQVCQKLADGLLPADWSPDGTRLAVENWQAAGDSLEEYDLATGVSTPLQSLPRPSYRAAYSPDGTSLLFQVMRAQWEVWRLDFGSTPIRILGGPGVGYAGPVWSPDGQMIALCTPTVGTTSEDVFTAGVDGSALYNVTQSPSYTDTVPNWAPDGSQIVFVSNRNGGPHLFAVSPSGGPVTQLTFGQCEDREPDWSPLF